jgi:hypothetical protein
MPSNIFTALVLSLPTRNKTARMRVWRALRAIGCGVLRDGVYLLPSGAPQAARFIGIESEVVSAGGFAMTVELDVKTSSQFERVRKLFDRTPAYSTLVGEIESARRTLARLGPSRGASMAKQLRRTFLGIVETDFFPGQANMQAEDALVSFERELARLTSHDEPRAAGRAVRRVNIAKYRKRLWVSRKNPWIDRLASAWLIKRFVDPDARFAWLDDPRRRAKSSVGFDFDDADFTHAGHRVTFETLMASFALDDDPALKRIAAMVHFLDAGGIPAAEAEGLQAILHGIRDKAQSDDELVLEAFRIFDHLRSAFTPKEDAP